MTALWAALGVGLGAVIKNQVFAVIGLIVWAFVIDNLLRELVPDVGRFTPVGASDSLTAGFADYLLAPVAGGLLLVAYAVAFVAAGAILVARRDVT
jgi:ABC-2 type transport system permease protein